MVSYLIFWGDINCKNFWIFFTIHVVFGMALGAMGIIVVAPLLVIHIFQYFAAMLLDIRFEKPQEAHEIE